MTGDSNKRDEDEKEGGRAERRTPKHPRNSASSLQATKTRDAGRELHAIHVYLLHEQTTTIVRQVEEDHANRHWVANFRWGGVVLHLRLNPYHGCIAEVVFVEHQKE